MTDASTFGVALPANRSATDRATEFGVTMPSASSPSDKVYYNDAGQPFTTSGKPPPADQGYTGTILPLRKDDTGIHPAVPEAIASPIRGMAEGGMRAFGIGEAGQNPLRPLSSETLGAVATLAGSPLTGASIGREVASAAKPVAAAADKGIDRSFARTVKPSVSGKADAGAIDRYVAQSRSAMSSIVANKPNLQFTDASGRAVKGELPQTLEQFGQAIDQTKHEIFKKYDAMAKQAGDEGATVDLRPTVAALAEYVKSPAIRDLDPGLIRKVLDTVTSLANRKVYSTSDAQDAVQHLNAKLTAFYSKGGSADDASMAGVYATIAGKLREGLDDTIERAVAPGYQQLKSDYGALKAIEKHVASRVQVVARQEPGGILSKFASVGSIAEILHGIATMNAAGVARGVGIKAGQVLMEHLRNPDRAVRKLFESVEKQQPAKPPPPSPSIMPTAPPPAALLPQQDQGAQSMGLQ